MVRLAFLIPKVLILNLIVFSAPTSAQESSNWDKAYGLLVSGTQRDIQASQSYLESAHSEGDARATFAIGVLKIIGRGYEEDTSDAAKYIRQSADSGLAGGQAVMAEILHSQGQFDSALQYATLGAENGSLSAMHILGDIFIDEKYAFRDFDKALQLYVVALLQGSPRSWSALQQVFATNRDARALILNDLEALLPAAEGGDVAAQTTVGMIYSTIYPNKNQTSHHVGIEFLKQAAKQGSTSAQYKLCEYYFGQFSRCHTAAEKGSTAAMLFLADHYYGTRDSDNFDYSKALHLAWNAAMYGDTYGRKGAVQLLDFFYGQIGADERGVGNTNAGLSLVDGLLIIFGAMIVADMIGGDNDPYNSNPHWDSYKEDQRRLERQTNEMKAIGWVSVGSW